MSNLPEVKKARHLLVPALCHRFGSHGYGTPGIGISDLLVVREFRKKLRIAEDLIAKLAFNLREIQNGWVTPMEKAPSPKDPPSQADSTFGRIRSLNISRSKKED